MASWATQSEDNDAALLKCCRVVIRIPPTGHLLEGVKSQILIEPSDEPEMSNPLFTVKL